MINFVKALPNKDKEGQSLPGARREMRPELLGDVSDALGIRLFGANESSGRATSPREMLPRRKRWAKLRQMDLDSEPEWCVFFCS